MQSRQQHSVIKLILLGIVLAIAIAISLNRQWITDQLRVWQFKPTDTISAISERRQCDGGFCLEPLIDKSSTIEQFRPKGVENFSRQIREIRNVLSHGKDFPRDGVFRPTRRNLRLLRPWVSLMALASGEVVLGRVSR